MQIRPICYQGSYLPYRLQAPIQRVQAYISIFIATTSYCLTMHAFCTSHSGRVVAVGLYQLMSSCIHATGVAQLARIRYRPIHTAVGLQYRPNAHFMWQFRHCMDVYSDLQANYKPMGLCTAGLHALELQSAMYRPTFLTWLETRVHECLPTRNLLPQSTQML